VLFGTIRAGENKRDYLCYSGLSGQRAIGSYQDRRVLEIIRAGVLLKVIRAGVLLGGKHGGTTGVIRGLG
jgi:hypothetical protein